MLLEEVGGHAGVGHEVAEHIEPSGVAAAVVVGQEGEDGDETGAAWQLGAVQTLRGLEGDLLLGVPAVVRRPPFEAETRWREVPVET